MVTPANDVDVSSRDRTSSLLCQYDCRKMEFDLDGAIVANVDNLA